MKKIFSLFLSAVMLVSVFGIVPMTAQASMDEIYYIEYVRNNDDIVLSLDDIYYSNYDNCYYFTTTPFYYNDYILVSYYDADDDDDYYAYYTFYYDDYYDTEYFVNDDDDDDVIYPDCWIENGDIDFNNRKLWVSIYPGIGECVEKVQFDFDCSHKYQTYYHVDRAATMDSDGVSSTRCDKCHQALNTATIPKISAVYIGQSEFTFNGWQKTPAIAVKDSSGKTLNEGVDYDVVYPGGRVNVGEYKVWVNFKGNYSGSTYKIFDIYPQDTKITKKSGVKKGFKINFKRSYQVDGYEIQYSLKKNFKGAKTVTASASATAKTVKKLKSKKNYYVRIRAYKRASGYIYRTAWSKTVKVKTK